MSESHIFSTGALTAQSAIAYLAARGHYQGGAPTTPSATSLANLSDGDPETTATCNADTGGYEYFLLDLGTSVTIARINIFNATVGSGATISVQISDTRSTAGIPGDGTGAPAGTTTGLIAATGNTAPVTNANLSFAPVTGTTATGRYIYLTFSGAGSGANVAVGEVKVYPVIPFALVQNATVEVKYQRKELFDASQVSAFSVDCADHEGKWTLKVQNASISATALQLLVAAALSSVTGPPAASVNTLPSSVQLPLFLATLALTDTSGKAVTVTLNQCKADGVSIPFKLADFALQDFTLTAYPDADGNLGTIAFQR